MALQDRGPNALGLALLCVDWCRVTAAKSWDLSTQYGSIRAVADQVLRRTPRGGSENRSGCRDVIYARGASGQ
jgi:hypothetical protein